MSPQFFNDHADVLWVKSGSLSTLNPPEFGSFTLFGNEDSPERVELHSSNDPLYTDLPVAVYVMGGLGQLELEIKEMA